MAEELNIGQQIENPNDKIKVLYNAVSKDYDLGDFNEFSKKLQNPDSRKKFYDVVGKEFDLGGYNDFIERVTIIPEKKNLGFQGVSTNFPITSVSPSQKSAKEALQEGAGMADNSFLRQINASNPLIGILPKDEGILPSKYKGLEEPSLKEIREGRKEPKQYYNAPLEKGVIFTGDTEMMAPGSKITEEDAKKLPLDVTIKNKFAQDYIEKIRREPTTYEVEGSYFDPSMDPMGGIHLTIAQNALDQFVSKAAELGSGLATKVRDFQATSQGIQPTEISESSTWLNDPLGKVVLGLNGIKSDFRGDLQYNGKLPDTMFGKIVSGGIGIIPDIAGAALLPEVELFQGAGLLMKAGKFFTKKFPIYLGTSRAIGEYGEEREAGKTPEEAGTAALKGGVKGYGEGLAMELAGMLSGIGTKAAMKPLEKMGITGVKGQITKEGINTITDAIGYGALVPLASAGMEGRMPTADEYIQGVGLSLPFSAMRIFKNARTNAQLNDAVDKIEALQAGISLANFVDATTPSIVDVFNGKETAAELNLKSLEFAKKARETTDLKLKQDYIIQSTIAKKAANVKQIAETVVNDKNGFKEFRESNLPEDIKQAFLDKAAEVYKELNPTEQQKTDLGKRITQAQTFVDDLTTQMNAEIDPVKKAELKYQIDETNKLLEKQNTDLTDIIAKQAKEREEYNKPEVEETEKPTKKVRKPSKKTIQRDIDNGNLVSFTYEDESQVPEPFKDNITSTGENNGVKFVRVSVPKSVADYELSKIKEPTDVTLVTEPTEIKGFKVIKRTQDGPNGEPIYEVEGGKFLTADGKELKGAKVKLPKAEVKPTEIKLENVTSNKRNQKFDTPTLKSPASNYEKLYVPKNVVEEAYKNDKDNNPVFGNGNQSLDRIIERGGYSIEELNKLLPNWKELSKSEVKPTEDIYFNQLHRTEKFDDNASVSTYLGHNKNEKNIFYTLPNKGIISYDEVIPNTNRFTITANAKNDTPADIKNAFERIEKYLPANHKLLENKSISVDGLKIWDKFIKNKKYVKTGEINEVQITPIDKANLFKDLKYTTENKWSGAKFENKGEVEALARVEKYLKDNNLDFKVKLDGNVIKVEVPILKYKPTEQVKPTEVKVEVEEKIEPVVTQKEIKSTANKIRSLKIKLDKNVLQSNIAGVPIAVYNVAIESIARAVEAGETIAKAVKDAIKKYKLDENKGFDLDEFTNGITSKLPTSKYKKGDVLDIEEGDYKTAAKVIKQNKDNFKKNLEAVTPEPQLDKNGKPKIEVTVGDDGKRSVQIIYKSVPYNLENGALKFVSKDRKKAIDVLSDKLVEDYNENKDKPEISAAIGWYGNMRNWFQKNFGANIEMFGQLLAATSARTEVVDNFKQAVEAMRNLSKGKYDELLKDYDNHIKSIKELSDSELLKKWQEKNPNKRLSEFVPNDYRRFLINQYEKVPLRSNGKKFNANSKKVLQALHGNWIEQTEGPKTKNFAGNLTGRSFEATIDVWAARYLRRKIYEGKAKEWRILPQSEGGVQYGKLKSGGMSGDYPFAEEVMKKAADKLGVKADDLQAFLWYLEKDVWDKNNWTNVIGKKKASFEEAAKGVASDRYQAAVTTFRTPETFDPVKFEQERKSLENEIGKIPGIIISRVNASEGEFRSATDIFIEPTYDVEFTVDKNADISNVIKKVNEIQAKYDQDATIISRFVDATHPNARPIIEIGLAEPVEKSDIIEDIKKTLSDLNVRGFTIARDRQGKILGVRSQFVPEFEDNVKMEEGLDRFATAFEKINEKYGDNKKISYLSTDFVDSKVKFKENGTTENEQNGGNRPQEQGIQGELPKQETRPSEGISDVSKEQGKQNGGQRNRTGDGVVPESEIPGISEQKTTSKEKVQGIVANVRNAKIDLSKLSDGGPQLNILGLPVAVYNAALETIAVAIESGATLADAIAYAIEKHKLDRKEKFNKQELIKKLEELTGEKVESEKEITEKLQNKPRTLADEFADAEKRKSEKSIQNAKNKIIKDNFGKIVDELLNNNKIDRIC